MMPDWGFLEQALDISAEIQPEGGRWVVYLRARFWSGPDGLETVPRRIADYPTQQEAEVAARYMQRAANRDLVNPPNGM